MLYFNTAGRVAPEEHYCVLPIEQVDLEGLFLLIRQKKYFVRLAPRQTGKMLGDLLNEGVAGPLRRGPPVGRRLIFDRCGVAFVDGEDLPPGKRSRTVS